MANKLTTKQETEILDEVIVKNRRKMLALSATALAAGFILRGSAQAQAAYSDSDILNFALNLEFLEANYYYLSAFGCTIDQPNAAAIAAGAPAAGIPITGSVGTAGGTATAVGSNPSGTPFSTIQTGSYATETAIEEGKHVLFLQAALGSLAVAQPQISLDVATWTALAQAAGVITNSQTFTPYDNDGDFLVGAYVFEDVGVTAYHGAASLLTMSANLSAAAGILAVEAYHAGLVRTNINNIPNNSALVNDTNLISTLRAQLSLAASPTTLNGAAPNPYDTNPDDFGLATFTTPSGLGSGAAVTATRITDADSTNVIAFARTTTQVLNIVTGGGKVVNNAVVTPATGIFFPAGLNAGPNGFN